MTRPTDPPDDPVEAARRRLADKAAARAEFATRRTRGLVHRQRRKAGRPTPPTDKE